MHTVYRIVVASFIALVAGAVGGSILDDVRTAIIATPQGALAAPIAFDPLPKPRPNIHQQTLEETEIGCLGNILFREANTESVGIRRLIAMVVIARRDGGDPQWPRTICGIMRQSGAISNVDRVIHIGPRGLRALEFNMQLAADVYEGAWKTQLLPRGWECVRYWRISDEALAKSNAKRFAQLGITKEMKGLSFFDKLREVKSPNGDTAFFRDPNRCNKKLPTT